MNKYQDKFSKAIAHSSFQKLSPKEKTFLKDLCFTHRFTFQEIRQLIDMAADFMAWGETPLDQYPLNEKANKDQIFKEIKKAWQEKRNEDTQYPTKSNRREVQLEIIDRQKKALGLGHCPVYSPKTRCCGLLTLDAVDNCGQDCSYCSIQSFFSDDKVYFDTDFTQKLETLELDPKKRYHIGTGQSSDSLMWGNRKGILDALFTFAQKWPNVILELKSKSNNIDYLLKNEIPKNMIITWSLNPPIIIENEEHGCCSLEERIEAAEMIANKGTLIGFHFHPMIHYKGWENDYSDVFQKLTNRLDPSTVALVSFGTLTYTSSIIKKIRARNIQSKILQIPFEEIAGKYSYPYEKKVELFKKAYQSFSSWHNKVFFYLCMEDIKLWKPVFGFEYEDNDHFEEAMIKSYSNKIEKL